MSFRLYKSGNVQRLGVAIDINPFKAQPTYTQNHKETTTVHDESES